MQQQRIIALAAMIVLLSPSVHAAPRHQDMKGTPLDHARPLSSDELSAMPGDPQEEGNKESVFSEVFGFIGRSGESVMHTVRDMKFSPDTEKQPAKPAGTSAPLAQDSDEKSSAERPLLPDRILHFLGID